MTKFLAKTLNSVGSFEIPADFLARGGEGEVYSLNSHNVKGLPSADSLVFKKYYKPNEANREVKVDLMLKNSPENENLAWPVAVVYDENKKFHGYLMKKLNFDIYRPWADFAHARERKNVSEDFDLKYAVVSVLNFAKAVKSVNDIGFFIGDLNESNAFVSNEAKVFLVDLDAGQISDNNGKIYACTVGKPEFTAPEISYGSFVDNPRTLKTEIFALSVASWMMLTGGQHPTDGIFKGKGEPPTVIERIRDGVYPALLKNKEYNVPSRVPVKGIPSRLKTLFISSFNVNPDERPDVQFFINVFEDVYENLVQCENVKQHWFDKRDGKCGWCEHVKNGGVDPWNVQPAFSSQTALPSLNFNKPKKAPSVRSHRVPAASNQNVSSQQTTSPVNQNIPQQHFSQKQSVNQNIPKQHFSSIPEKIKGKSVLIYSDGTWGVRPPLRVLFKTNPKVAFSSVKTETPGFLRFWWGAELPVMDKKAGVLGYLLSLLISLVWFFLVPLCENFVSDESFWVFMGTYNLWFILGVSSAVSSFIFSTFLFFSGLFDRRKFFKSNGKTAIPKVLSLTKTLFKFGLIALFYGPFFIISVLGLILFNIVSWLFSQLRVG